MPLLKTGNMRLFLLLSFLINVQLLAAQTPGREDSNIWNTLGENLSYTVSAKKAMIRKGPSVNEPALDSLSSGDKVMFREQAKVNSSIKGIYAPWIKVEYSKNDKTVTGYVWLGLLGFHAFEKGDTSFVYSIESASLQKSVPDFTETRLLISLKAIHKSEIIASKEWTVPADESTSFVQGKTLGNVGLQNLHEVFRLTFSGEACGVPSNYYYHGWDGKKLFDLPGKYTVGDAGVFYHWESLLFPNEKGGKPGYIIKLIEEEELVQEETATQKEKFKKSNGSEVYIWNGEKAILQKKNVLK